MAVIHNLKQCRLIATKSEDVTWESALHVITGMLDAEASQVHETLGADHCCQSLAGRRVAPAQQVCCALLYGTR